MRARTAFTLVELLVVIGIIAVLIGVLLPALRRAQESGRQIACSSNLRQLGQAIALYVSDNRGYLPVAIYDGADPKTNWITWPPNGQLEECKFYPYLKGSLPKVMSCPSDDPSTHATTSLGRYPYSYTLSIWIFGPDYVGKASRIILPGMKISAIEESIQSLDDSVFNIYQVVFSGGNIMTDRHSPAKGNALFADGHCEAVDRSLFGPTFPIHGEYFDPWR